MLHIDVNFIDRLAKTCKKFPDRAVDIMQSVKKNQLKSKTRVFNHIANNSRVCVVGGWYGAPYLLANPTCTYTFVDIDPCCAEVGRYMWENKSHFATADAADWDYSAYDIVINSSTEHMDKDKLQKMFSGLHPGQTVILQNSNQHQVHDHINCFDSIESYVDWVSAFLIVGGSFTDIMDNNSKRFTLVCRSM